MSQSLASAPSGSALPPGLAPGAAAAPRPFTDRQGAIDGVRGVAVIAMIVVHCFCFFAAYDTQEHSAGFVILDLGKLTAVFILCMGASSAFSRRRAPGDLARRGVELLLTGYGLNVLKFLVPILIFRAPPDGLTRDLGWEVGTTETLLHYLFLGDILHMVGLSLLIVAGLRALGARAWHLFALGGVIASVAPLVWGFRTGGPLTTYLCDLLFSERFTVFFPLAPWAAYVLIGFALGDLLRGADAAPSVVYGRWCGAGALLLAAGVAVGLAFPPLWKGWDFYRTGPAGVAAVTGVTMMMFLVSHVLWSRLPRAVTAVFGYFSRNVTRLYVISWVAISWLVCVVGFMSHESFGELLELTALVFALTLGVDAAIRAVATRLRRP